MLTRGPARSSSSSRWVGWVGGSGLVGFHMCSGIGCDANEGSGHVFLPLGWSYG